MEFYEEEKESIFFDFKLRVILTFITTVIATIACAIISIVFFTKGDDLVGSFVAVAGLLALFGAVCSGIYIYSRRTRKSKKKIESK